MIKIWNRPLYSEQEIIKAINSKIGVNALNKSMFAYMRDIRGLIPKPIRIKSDNKVGGARSYYLKDTLDSLMTIMEENKKRGKSLKEIKTQQTDLIEKAMFATETFRKEFYELNNLGKEMGKSFSNFYDTKIKPLAKAFQKYAPDIRRHALIEHLEETLKALKGSATEEEIEKLLEELVFMYNQRIKFRMRKQAEQANLGK